MMGANCGADSGADESRRLRSEVTEELHHRGGNITDLQPQRNCNGLREGEHTSCILTGK